MAIKIFSIMAIIEVKVARNDLESYKSYSRLIATFVPKCQQNTKHVIGIFIDLSKAFDTIDHSKLLVTLHEHNSISSCHKLLTNYLLKREQYINC